MEKLSVRYIVDDVEKAIPFYTEALGFVVEMHPAPGFAALSRDGARLFLNEPGVGSAGHATTDGSLPRPGGWNRLQVEVKDLDAKVASLRRDGRVLRGEPVSGKGGRQVLVEDPSGNPVELFEPAAKPRVATEAAAPLAALSHAVELELAPPEAFALFTAGLGDWWPLAYTFTEADFATARIEPVVGGRWFERDESGRELPWGEVRAFEEGRRLVLSFGIGPDRKPGPPEEASEVEVRFVPAGAGRTRVELEHRDFAKLGEAGATLREGMGSPQGWPLILAELKREAGRRAATSGGSVRSR